MSDPEGRDLVVPGDPGRAQAQDDRAKLPARAALLGLAGFVTGAAAGLALAVAADVLGLPGIVVFILNVAGMWAGLLSACWYASRRYGTGDVARDYGLQVTGTDVKRGIMFSLLARLAGILVLLPLPPRFIGSNQEVFGRITTNAGTFAVFALVACVGAPIMEELFFRGLLLRSLRSAFGPAAAIATQAVLFGLVHYSPLLGVVNVSVIASIAAGGVMFGIAADRHGVGTSVVAHSAFNLVSVIAAAFLVFG